MASSFSSRPVKQAFLSCLENEGVGDEFIRDIIRSQIEDDDVFTLFDRRSIDLRDAKDDRSIEKMILRAIRTSSISIVVFSEKYASSDWFLTELLEIWECKILQGQKVTPIFWGVDPSDVLNQVGKFGDALRRTSDRYAELKNINWKQVLNDVAGAEGFIYNKKLKKFDITASSSSRNEETQPLLPVDIEPSSSPVDAEPSSSPVDAEPSSSPLDTEPPSSSPVDVQPSSSPPLDIEPSSSSPADVQPSSSSPFYIEPSSSSQISKSPRFTRIVAFLVFLSFVTEITSFVSEILSEHLPIHERSFTILSFTMSILSVLICLIQVLCQARDDKASFRWERPIPWFYYEAHDKLKISGSHTDRVLLFCAVGELIVWTINFTFNRQGLDRLIPTSVMPVLFSFGMIVSMFFGKKYIEKPIISANQDQNNSMV